MRLLDRPPLRIGDTSREVENLYNYLIGYLLPDLDTDATTADLNAAVAIINTALAGKAPLATTANPTLTGTGFVVNPTFGGTYTKQDKVIVLTIPLLSGTSNATTFTITGLPAAFEPPVFTATGIPLTWPIAVTDNGISRVGLLTLGSGAVMTLYADGAYGPWVNSGLKGIPPSSLSWQIA